MRRYVWHSKLIRVADEVDFVLAVGKFLPPNSMSSRMSDYVGANALRQLPVPVYFIDSASEVFIKQAEEAKKPVLLQPNLSFLGSCGVTEVEGLRIAFLSGCYDPDVFKQQWGRGLYAGPHYTSLAIERIEKKAAEMHRRGERIDILLTSEWPDKVWSSHTKRWVAPIVQKDCASPAVSRLVAKLCPQFHVHGLADRFSRVRSERRAGATTAVALAHVRDRIPDGMVEDEYKWFEPGDA